MDASSDVLPNTFSSPLEAGGTLGNVPDLDRLLAGAYAELRWDPRTGRPEDPELARLGLGRPAEPE